MDQDSGTRFARPVDRYVSRGALERGGRRVAGRARSLVTAQRSSPRQPVFRDLRQTLWQEAKVKFQVPSSKSQVRSENLKLETRNLKLLDLSVQKAPPAWVVSVLSHSPC